MGCERSSYMLLRNGSKPVRTGVRTALIHRRALLICPWYPPKHEKGRNFHGDSCDERVLWIQNLFYDMIHTELEITSADTVEAKFSHLGMLIHWEYGPRSR